MKALNHFLGLFLITTLVGMTSCAKQDLEIKENLIPTTKSASVAVDIIPISVSNSDFNLSSDFFSMMNFTIEDEIIMLTASYPGGCGDATFKLVADSQIQYNSNNTPIFDVKLILDDKDKCTDEIKTMVFYSLTPLKLAGHNKVILRIANLGDIVYNY